NQRRPKQAPAVRAGRPVQGTGVGRHLSARSGRRGHRVRHRAARAPVWSERAMEFINWVRTQWDRAGALAALAAGAVALLFGYLGISDATLPTEQIPYLASGGLFG